MEYLNCDKIFELCKDIDNDLQQKREINKLFKSQDESHLWPISNKFNVTERAIRQAQKFERESGTPLLGLEYCYFLDERISKIVNNENNW